MIKAQEFGSINGKIVTKYTISRGCVEVDVIDYGATIISIRVPDKSGKIIDVALGYKTLEEYINNGGYMGASIGRVANRIGGHSFEYCGVVYPLYNNDNGNTLHGGREGFDSKIWNSEIVGESVIMTYSSPDGEEGFFGNLDVEVEFFIDENRGLTLAYTAVTDSESAVNLTNHAYFNLNGEGSGDVLNHTLQIKSSCITAIDKNLIPTGEFMDVANTPFDFTSAKKIAKDIDVKNEQLDFAGGYDHNFVLDLKDENNLSAVVTGDKSGVVMEVYTNQNGVQFYGGNFLDGVMGKSDKPYNKRNAFCLETQAFPNALNIPSFGQQVIRVGEVYKNIVTYRFVEVK